MPDVDLSRLPTGQLAWAALIEYVKASDDRVERYFLEVKSEVDLATKLGRHKVAKFILGAANRDPEQAARRFGGHALLMLGVGGGEAPGIPGFEAKDLQKEVQKFIGPAPNGPRWDFHTIRAGQETDVVVIVVDPPTGAIWTCLADGSENLHDGDIYVRADGETRKATGSEIRSMLARAGAPVRPAVDVVVDLDGCVNAIGIDLNDLQKWIALQDAAYRGQVAPAYGSGSFAMLATASIVRERRSEDEFLTEVEAWRNAAVQDPAAGVHGLVARVGDGVGVRVANRSTRFLQEVRIDLEFDGEVQALDWQDRDDSSEIDLFPDRPKNWGSDTLMLSSLMDPSVYRAVASADIEVTRENPLRLTRHLPTLRPEHEDVSVADEVVLVQFVGAEQPAQLTGRWTMTAEGLDEVFRGTFVIPIEYRDWRGPIVEMRTHRFSSALRGDEPRIDDL